MSIFCEHVKIAGLKTFSFQDDTPLSSILPFIDEKSIDKFLFPL